MKRLVLGITLLQGTILADDNYIGKYLCNEQQIVKITKYTNYKILI